MFRKMHLKSSKPSETACGHSLMLMPTATNWEGFKATTITERCEKCNASKQAALNHRRDVNRVTL